MADAGASTSKSPKAKAKASKPKSSNPPFLVMAKDAISSLGDKKGSSVHSIQTYIAGNYNLDVDFVKIHLKPALAKGIENETFVRPKGSDAKGYTGRFKLNKVKETEEAKAKAKKEKETAKKEKENEAAKKTVKKTITKAKKPKNDTKSPKKVVKKKTASKTALKSPKAKAPKSKAGARTPKQKAKTAKVHSLSMSLLWVFKSFLRLLRGAGVGKYPHSQNKTVPQNLDFLCSPRKMALFPKNKIFIFYVPQNCLSSPHF